MHYLCYERGLNIQWEWDLSHSLSNASKGALRPACSYVRPSPCSFLACCQHASHRPPRHIACPCIQSWLLCKHDWHTSVKCLLAVRFQCASLLPARRAGLYRWQILMCAAQNCVYGSTMSPPRLAQIRQACHDHFAAHSVHNDPLFQLYAPSMASQMKIDSSVPGRMEAMYAGLKDSQLLWTKGEKVCSAVVLIPPERRASRHASPVAPLLLTASPLGLHAGSLWYLFPRLGLGPPVLCDWLCG